MTSLAGPLYVVVGVLAVAGAAKLAVPAPTATALRRLRIPAPRAAARTLGALEVTIAVLAVATGAATTWALVAGFYVGFVGFVLWALHADEPLDSCGCFGREDTPPTIGHAAFNAAAAALAALAAADPVRLTDLDLAPAETVLFAGVVGIGIVVSVLALTALPRLLSVIRGTTPAPARQFSFDRTSSSPR